MKTTKRLLAVLLVLALGLALFAPVAAAVGADEDTPLFTKRMPRFTLMRWDENNKITLSAEAKLPEGVDAELQYQWFYGPWNEFDAPFDEFYIIEGATEPQYTISLLSFHYLQVLNGLPIGFKSFRLEASYVTDDGTVIVDNDYTMLFCRHSLDELFQHHFIYIDQP